MENKFARLKSMLAQVREDEDVEHAFRSMGFSVERAEALAKNKSVRAARALHDKTK